MSSLILEGQWEADSSGLWFLSTTHTPRYVSEGGLGTVIESSSGTEDREPPFARGRFFVPPPPSEPPPSEPPPPLDLSQVEELRFWFRSSRPGDGSPGKPLYLAFEIERDPPGLSWRWFLPVKQREVWELHRLWLGDDLLPDELRQAVGFMRIRSLDATTAFIATIGDLIVTTPEPLQDVDAALLRRLDMRFRVPVGDTPTGVPAIVELPENPGDRTTPYILIIPWSVQPNRERGGSGEIVDNYVPEIEDPDRPRSEGVFVRPPLWLAQIEYAIDVFAEERDQKTRLLDAILDDFSRQPFLVVDGEPLTLIPFVPSPEQITEFAAPGRTPLFYQLTVPIETGTRQFQSKALSPHLLVGHRNGRTAGEEVKL